ncbi:MAG: CpcT/CpeT family chromophore lyase [Rhodospirillaceae bacterium]|nr:CpcT/CpeT family chromophore lyase [Rhodospirillaceae bacterium]
MPSILRMLFFLLATVVAAAPARADSAADFQRFVGLWAGDYDNLKQANAQDAAGVPAKERNQPTLLFIRKVDLPAFGTEVFYAEWRDGKNPGKVTRQRIYALEIDGAEKKLRLNLHIWPADKPDFVARTVGAHLDPAKLAGVMPADMAGLKGCDVFFDVGATEFLGAMKKGACAFPAPDGTPIYSWSQMKIDEQAFSYLDGWFRLDHTPFMQFTKEWFVFERRN